MFLHPLLLASLAAGAVLKHSNSVKETTCKGETYQYQELAGYGLIKSNARDKFGDTIGGIGSAISIPRASCKRGKHGAYTGTLFATPDRGWNTQGAYCQIQIMVPLTLTLYQAPSIIRTASTSSASPSRPTGVLQ